jgi:hypothetical protein
MDESVRLTRKSEQAKRPKPCRLCWWWLCCTVCTKTYYILFNCVSISPLVIKSFYVTCLVWYNKSIKLCWRLITCVYWDAGTQVFVAWERTTRFTSTGYRALFHCSRPWRHYTDNCICS